MSASSDPKRFFIHLISDATGTTLQSLARAALSQFEGIEPEERYWPLIRTDRQLQRVLEDVKKHSGLVLYTFVDETMRLKLRTYCEEHEIPHIAVLDPLLKALSSFTGLPARGVPGLQHVLDDDYFKRVDAIDFALGYDDGRHIEGIAEADVVLVGVSRTSKTPTCIFLARRGIKAANIPLVPNVPFPRDAFRIRKSASVCGVNQYS